MAKMVTIEYVDDLDGASIDADSVDTVEFSYRGTTYSLMLSADNGTQFDRDMARYIQAAQKAAAVEAREARKAGRRGRDPVARNFEIVPIDSTEPEARSATGTRGGEEHLTPGVGKGQRPQRISAREACVTVVEAYDAVH